MATTKNWIVLSASVLVLALGCRGLAPTTPATPLPGETEEAAEVRVCIESCRVYDDQYLVYYALGMTFSGAAQYGVELGSGSDHNQFLSVKFLSCGSGVRGTSGSSNLFENCLAQACSFAGVQGFGPGGTVGSGNIKFMLEDSDFADKSGFIPTIKAREPGLAQLKEFMSYQPTIIPVKNNSPRFTEVGNRAKIDFYGGSYVQSVMLSSNFEQALEQLDSRWDKAKKRVK